MKAGLLLVDKPAGPTSHDVVGWVRWALRDKQVGHCGTLDPAATGLMVVCVGAATKLATLLTGADKVYRAWIELGRATTTADGEGETVAEAAVADEVLARADAELCSMVGTLMLAPPAFSAVHVEGKRAHELARKGVALELAPREMVVRSVSSISTSTSTSTPVVQADLEVSKGTYIRSLAVELGRRLGVPAHLRGLRRIAAGSHRIDDPKIVGPLSATSIGERRFRITPPAITERDEQGEFLRARLLPAWTGLPIPVLHLDPSEPAAAALGTRLGHGQTIALDDPGWGGEPPHADAAVVVSGEPGAVIVVARQGPAVRPKRVVSPA